MPTAATGTIGSDDGLTAAMTSLPQPAQRPSLEQVEEWLARAQNTEASRLGLDLTHFSALPRETAALLTNALVGTFGTADLRLKVGEVTLDWLQASGLAFAIANRSGPTTLEDHRGRVIDDRWARDWLPTDVPPTTGAGASEPLFSPSEIGETMLRPDLFGPGYAAFVNPHLSDRGDREVHPLNVAIWPWLDRLLPGRNGGNKQTREQFLTDVGRLVEELVDNVAEHAAVRMPDVASLVQLSVTRGGGLRSRNRLHVAVQDTGPGIASTARPKVEAALRASLFDAQLIARLLEGSMAPWGRARGQGLPEVVKVARRWGTLLHLSTKTTRVSLDPGDGSIRTSSSTLRLDGTLLMLTISLPGS